MTLSVFLVYLNITLDMYLYRDKLVMNIVIGIAAFFIPLTVVPAHIVTHVLLPNT